MRAAREQGAQGPNLQSGTPWLPLGPAPLISDQNFYGAVSGRVTALAIDQSDASGNTVYVAGASGGVWKSTTAASTTATSVSWAPLTDQQASLVNGAVSVKADGSVVLVGTGEPNSTIDSYYGVGILRSTNHGGSWTLITSADGGSNSFAGLGFAKFAWDSSTPTTVVAATGATTLGIDDGDTTGNVGLYYSNDSGQTWAFQTPQDSGVSISPASISATDVVYNAAAGKYFAAIRYHGLYTSTNGQNWTRLTNQPNPTILSTSNCPATIPGAGSSCPIYRGQLTVVPGREEMYFWFVSLASQDGDVNVLDEGIWRSNDGGSTWSQINETGITNCGDPGNNGCGVELGYYNLEITAVPNGQATDLYAGAVNLFKCELTNGGTTCATLDPNFPNDWINLTHVYGCSSIAGVHPDEHGLDFILVGGKAVMYFGNDGGIYRALNGFTDLDSGSCGVANSFDNLNASSVPGGTIGSLTQFVSLSLHPTDPDTILGGTQGNGSAGTSTATASPQWTTVNGGDGGYNAINPATPEQWFAANPFVSIYTCNSGANCTTQTFSLTVGSGEVGGDGSAFYAPYILDPQDPAAMLVGTCRVWSGTPTVPPSSFSPLSVDFDTLGNDTCTGEEINLVSALAAGGPVTGRTSTVVYAGTEGTGPDATSPSGGEVWATTNAGITQMAEVTGSVNPSNYTISSVAVDTSDTTGATAYVGIMGFLGTGTHIWQTTNAGATWAAFGATASGLPDAPVNALLVDASSGTVYAGTDVGVFMSSTTSTAWTEVGTAPGQGSGYLPNVPVSAIRLFNSGGVKKLRVSTYGRGIWEYALPQPPDYTNVISNTPQIVYPTQNATFNGALTAVGGFASQVNLSCTGPAPVTCTLNPTEEIPTATYTLTAGGTVGDYNFNAHAVGTDGKAITHDAAVTLHVVDFNISAPDPNSLTVAQGGTSNSSAFQVSAAGSFSGTVSLTCSSGLPAGTACLFSPSSAVNPTAANPITVTMTVTAAAGTPQGGPTTVVLSANAAGAPAAKTQTFKLNVTGPPPDFTLAVTATPNATVVGQSVIWNGTLTALNGYNEHVNLSCSGTVPGTCSFNPSSLVPTAGGATFTVTVGSATTGAFNFTIQGTDGTLTHSQAASLAVGTDVTWSDTGGNAVTVEAGQSAMYSFSAVPAGGAVFTGAVTFACTNLPALTSCGFSPASIGVGAGATAVTVTISTTGPNQGGSGPQQMLSSEYAGPRDGPLLSNLGKANKIGFALASLLAIPLAGLFLTGLRREALRPVRFKRNDHASVIAGSCIALSWLIVLASCGGALGGGGGGPQQVTVTVSPTLANVFANAPGNTWPPSATQKQFSATVNNGSSQSVTWSVSGGGSSGTIDPNGLYSAPAIAPTPATATVTATSSLASSPGTAMVNIETATALGTYPNVQVVATAAGGTGHADGVALTVE